MCLDYFAESLSIVLLSSNISPCTNLESQVVSSQAAPVSLSLHSPFFPVLGLKPRTLPMLDECSVTKLHPNPISLLWVLWE